MISELKEIWLDSDAAQKKYGPNTLGLRTQIRGAFQPRKVSEIQKIVHWAQTEGCHLSVFSTGRNWGYGCSLPVQEQSLIVDLSQMKKILSHNEDLGLVTVEPGVTQQDLYEYLQKAGSKLIVPTTGAGPQAGILGNALDKGVGITPIEDHYAAFMSLQAVLADGSIYKSATYEFGGTLSDQIFKWKTGPVLDGLFAQSNLGIVTQGTFALARRPERTEQYVALVPSENLADVIGSIRRIRQTLGTLSGGINIMNERRILALLDEGDQWPHDRPISDQELSDLRKKKSIAPWVVVGALYGTKAMVKAGKKIVAQELRPKASQLTFLNDSKLIWGRRLAKLLPAKGLQAQIDAALEGLALLEGKPSTYAMKLAYLKNSIPFKDIPIPTPSHDKVGLIWFAPLIPIEAALVLEFDQRVNEICKKHGLDPIVTFIAISERCFDCPIPLLFDATKPEQVKRAKDCRDELFEMASQLGVFPHRLDVEITEKYFSRKSVPALEIHKKIKSVLDPHSIFSPGRYSSV